MRGLLIINPHATTTGGETAKQVASSLAGLVDLEVVHTQYRGHAQELAAAACDELVIVLGGDGAINEAVNGIMSRPPGAGAGNGPGDCDPPVLAIIPGGGGNVLARGLGVPVDTAAAVAKIADAITVGEYRTIGLGLAGDRYFTFSAGLGMDAEVVGEVDRLRAAGHRESASLFLGTMMRSYYSGTDRRTPALTLERDGHKAADDLFMTIITNRSPWTYFRSRPLLPVPNPDFNSGLDVLALRRLRLRTIFGAVGQMLWIRRRSPRGRNLLSVPGLESFTVRSARPIALQVDGEYLGETDAVRFQFIPRAIRVAA